MNRLLLVAGCAIMVAGCKIGPNYRRPEVPSPVAWRTAVPTGESLANLSWWEYYKDPALTNLIAVALENNKDLRVAAARIEQAMGFYHVQRAGLLPSVNASAAYTRGRSGLTRQTGNEVDLLGLLSYEIDIWGRLRRLTEAARAQLLASEEGRKAVYITLVGNVASAYFSLRALDEQLEIARRTLATRNDSLRLTRARFDDNRGIVSELDVKQAETQVHAAQASIAQLERGIAVTENALNMLAGRNPGSIERGATLDEQWQPAEIPAGLPSELLLRRPDILAAEQQLIAANANIGAARAAYFPTISLTAALGLQSMELDDLFDVGLSKTWKVAPQVVAPIFNAGRIRAGVQVAEAQRNELLASYEQAIQNAFREVDDALVSLTKLREQVKAEAAGVEAERARLKLSNARYDNGVSSYLDVLDAERSLFSAELNLVQTRSDQMSAVAQLYKALGGGWSEGPGERKEALNTK